MTGTVRVTIVDQPWNIALKKILDGYGLAAIEDSTGIITVDSYRNLAALAAVEPLTTRIIQVNYTKAEAMAATVRSLLGAGCGGAAGGAAGGAVAPDAGGAICSSRGSVGSDEKTNSVIVTETLAHLRNIEGYIKDLDVRTPQITIKAKIITVDRTGTEQLGLSYDLGTAGTFSNALLPRVGVIGDQRVNLTGDGFAGVANSQRQYKGSSSLTLISNIMLGGFNLTSFLDALSSVQLTDVQAEPSVTTIDNKQAELFSGSSIAYLLTPPIIPGQIQSVAPQIQRQDIGIRLQGDAARDGQPSGPPRRLRRTGSAAERDGGWPEHAQAAVYEPDPCVRRRNRGDQRSHPDAGGAEQLGYPAPHGSAPHWPSVCTHGSH